MAGAAARQISATCGSGPPHGYVPGHAMFGCWSHALTYIGMAYSALPSAVTLPTYRA